MAARSDSRTVAAEQTRVIDPDFTWALKRRAVCALTPAVRVAAQSM